MNVVTFKKVQKSNQFPLTIVKYAKKIIPYTKSQFACGHARCHNYACKVLVTSSTNTCFACTSILLSMIHCRRGRWFCFILLSFNFYFLSQYSSSLKLSRDICILHFQSSYPPTPLRNEFALFKCKQCIKMYLTHVDIKDEDVEQKMNKWIWK